MIQMLVRNRVSDFDRWKQVFDAGEERGQAAGLKLVRMWRKVDDPNNVFFLLDVGDINKAQAFLEAPESAKAGEISGVIDGEYHFLQDEGSD